MPGRACATSGCALLVLIAWACQGPPEQPTWLWGDQCDRRGPISAQFADITSESGFSFSNFTPDFRGGALAVADLDGDDLPDLIVSNRLGDFAVFGNLGGLDFTNRTATLGFEPAAGITEALAAGDLDNDGDQDLLLAHNGLSRTVRLYENDGSGRFSFAGSLLDCGAVEHLLLVDIDDDGLLDVHTSNSAFGVGQERANRLYMQREPWSFQRVDFPLGSPDAASWTATALDVDGDGDRDLYIANDTLAADFGFQVTEIDEDRAVDHLLRNDGVDAAGVPIFTDVAAQFGLAEPRSSMGGLVTDFDGDMHLDLFVPDFGANKLFTREQVDGLRPFTDSAMALGVRASHRGDLECHPDSSETRCLLLSWGSAFADFDGDGTRELLVVNGPTRFTDPFPPQLYFWPGPDGRFVELAPAVGCAEGHGLVPADLDRDGDLDLVVSVREGSYRLYENRGPAPGHWLHLRLRGAVSNRDGRGAVVTATRADGTTIIEVIGAGGVAFSSLPTELFISAGAQPLRALEVLWPSGRIDRVEALPERGPLVVTEGG